MTATSASRGASPRQAPSQAMPTEPAREPCVGATLKLDAAAPRSAATQHRQLGLLDPQNEGPDEPRKAHATRSALGSPASTLISKQHHNIAEQKYFLNDNLGNANIRKIDSAEDCKSGVAGQGKKSASKSISAIVAARVVDVVKTFADVGCTSAQVLEELGISKDSEAAKAVAKELSLQSTRVCSRRQELHGKPIVRLPAPPDSGAQVLYVHADEFISATAEERFRYCFLCAKNTLGSWQVLGGDYSKSSRIATFKDALVHCICESCFRTRFLGYESSDPVGFAVLPSDFFNELLLHKSRQPIINHYQLAITEEDEEEISSSYSLEKKMNAANAEVDLVTKIREKVLEETISEVRNFGACGGTWYDIVERVRVAILPQKLDNLKEVVQWSLHISSSKTLSSEKPLLRRAMVGFDGAVQVLFVGKEFIDPQIDNEGVPRRSELACGIRLEIAEQAVPGAVFGLRSFTSFRVLVEGNEGLPGFEVLRRYSDFTWLREELAQWYGDESVIPPLPRKQFLGRFNETFLDARMHALEHFIAIIVVHPVLHKAEPTQTFFQRCPLDQAKPEYYARVSQRARDKRSRRRKSAEWASSAMASDEVVDIAHRKPNIILHNGQRIAEHATVDIETLNRLLLTGSTRHRDGDVRVILGGEYQRNLRKCYKRMEKLAACYVRQAELLESRAKACKFLAATELPEIRELASDPRRVQELRCAFGADTPLTAEGRSPCEADIFSEVPLTNDRLPLSYSAMAVVELLSSLSRIDVLTATSNRAACIRTMETKMQLKEWHRSLEESTAWFENRAHSVVLLQRSCRIKRSLLESIHMGAHAGLNDEDDVQNTNNNNSSEATGSRAKQVNPTERKRLKENLTNLEDKVKSTRADASLEATWLASRNKQEMINHVTTFVQHQIEHARQQSRMWQDFLPQLLSSLEAQVPVLSEPIDIGNDAKDSSEANEVENIVTIDDQVGNTYARASSVLQQQNNLSKSSIDRSTSYVQENLDILAPIQENTNSSMLYRFGGVDEKQRMAQAQNDSAWEIDPADLVFGTCIGRGSFGEVHEGVFHGQRVAIKTFHATSSLSARALLDFRREAQVMRGLPAHPNLVSFYGMSSQPQHICLVMELVASGSMLGILLDDHKVSANAAPHSRALPENQPVNMNHITVRRGRKQRGAGAVTPSRERSASRSSWDLDSLDSQWRLKLALGAARGIRVLHESNPQILHRDIKTSNLLVSMPDLTVKVCDFGLARFKLESQSVRSFVGTASWVAPEVIVSRDDGYSAKADVYSFAVVLWQIYSRRQPYPRLHATQVLYQVAREGLRPRMPSNVPVPMEELIRECWSADASQRPNFAEIESRLEAILERESRPSYA